MVMVVATMIKYKMTMEKVIKTYADHLLIEVNGTKASSCSDDAKQVEDPVQLDFRRPVGTLIEMIMMMTMMILMTIMMLMMTMRTHCVDYCESTCNRELSGENMTMA